jgi:predicted deacetylase
VTHLLVIANETVAGKALTAAVKRRGKDLQVTVACPVNAPREGYVVYDDTRRAAARRRLDKTLAQLHAIGISADGYVVDADPVDAVRDALAQLEPPVDEIIVSTHPEKRSGWMRRKVVERIRKVAGRLPVEHVVVDLKEEGGEANVLVVANETVLGEPLLDAIKARAKKKPPASFMLICPQSDLQMSGHPEADRRLRRALAALRGAGIDAHGQIAHPDPYSAAMHAVQDERVDEIIVSTFPGQTSGWLRRDVVERIREATKLPVEHVEVAREAVAV